MTRRLVAAGMIRAGRATLVGMTTEPVRVEGDGAAIGLALAGTRAVSDLSEPSFAAYCDRIAALGAPALVYGDASYTRA